MDDGVSEQHADDFDAETDDLIITIFNFTFKSFLFAGTKRFKKITNTVISSYQAEVVSSIVSVI